MIKNNELSYNGNFIFKFLKKIVQVNWHAERKNEWKKENLISMTILLRWIIFGNGWCMLIERPNEIKAENRKRRKRKKEARRMKMCSQLC